MAKNTDNELRIRNVSPQVMRELDNIAANIGIPESAFIKMELRKVADSYPDHMKQPPKKN